jgi:hypothetical protein
VRLCRRYTLGPLWYFTSGLHRKPNGERYLSGTEWEYEDAVSATRQPEILVYRRTEKVLLDADDPKLPSKLEQRKRVNEFFERFRSTDGSYTGGVNSYDTPASFAERLKSDLRTLLTAKFDGKRATVVGPLASLFQRATKAFVEEYLVSETGRVRWSRLSEQIFRVDKWSACRG